MAPHDRIISLPRNSCYWPATIALTPMQRAAVGQLAIDRRTALLGHLSMWRVLTGFQQKYFVPASSREPIGQYRLQPSPRRR